MHVHSHDLSSLTWKLVEIFFWKKIKTLLHFHYILQGKLGLTQLTISTLSLLSKERDYRKLNKSGPRSDQTTAFILWDCLDEEIYKAAFQEELNCGEIAKKKKLLIQLKWVWSGKWDSRDQTCHWQNHNAHPSIQGFSSQLPLSQMDMSIGSPEIHSRPPALV